MRKRGAGCLKVAMIEPVGGHGGMDYYDFALCEALAEAGVDVTLHTCDETPNQPSPPYKVSFPYKGIYGAEPSWKRGIRYIRGSLSALVSARVDGARIVHFHFFHVGPLELFNVLFARILRLRVVATAHDVQSFVERLSVPWMVKAVYGLSDKAIAQSRISERELTKMLRVHETKIAVIPHGNYLSFVGHVPSVDEARSRLGLPRGARALLFFGQIKKVKGLDVLLQAMPKVIGKLPDTVLLIAGKVWKDDLLRYQEQIDTLGIAGNCRTHIRYILDSEVAAYYSAADIVVLPYRRIYQSGVLLMAMSYGKPVVASDIEGLAEVVEDGSNGYLFQSENADALADKLLEALSDPQGLRAVGERGLAYVEEHHDWGEIGRITAECYRSIVNAR